MSSKTSTDDLKAEGLTCEIKRRDFVAVSATALGAVGAARALWPFVDSMNPAADVRAQSSIKVSLKGIEPGQGVTVMWRGKPVFIRRRTADEIAQVRAVPEAELLDPQEDQKRVQKDEWLVVIGVCTHLGCVPTGQKPTDQRGSHGGWLCPCHGSEYDVSGRVRRGPAPTNLPVPEYKFLDDSTIQIG